MKNHTADTSKYLYPYPCLLEAFNSFIVELHK